MFASSPVATVCATDRDALVALCQATDGDDWRKSDKWLSDEPLDGGHGVAVDESGRVIELDLPLNELSGTIPSELGNLTNPTNLELLYFWGNRG